MPLALEIAMETDRTVYDSIYLALAISNQCQVTADLRFYNSLKNTNFPGEKKSNSPGIIRREIFAKTPREIAP